MVKKNDGDRNWKIDHFYAIVSVNSQNVLLIKKKPYDQPRKKWIEIGIEAVRKKRYLSIDILRSQRIRTDASLYICIPIWWIKAFVRVQYV